MVRPTIPLAVERVFWVHVGAGASVVAAARLSGVSRASGQRLFAASGGVVAERAGVVSLTLEGFMLSGAFGAARLKEEPPQC